MSAVWSEERKLAVWREVEILVVEAWVELGTAPQQAATAARSTPEVDPQEWKEREAVTHHDVAAFVDLLASSASTGGEWIHFGLTSSDVLDTANGVLLAEAGQLLVSALEELFSTVKARSFEFRDTIMIGRTHGIWAEPMSFGLKLASWAFEIHRDHERLREAVAGVSVGSLYQYFPNKEALVEEVRARFAARFESSLLELLGVAVIEDLHLDAGRRQLAGLQLLEHVFGHPHEDAGDPPVPELGQVQ